MAEARPGRNPAGKPPKLSGSGFAGPGVKPGAVGVGKAASLRGSELSAHCLQPWSLLPCVALHHLDDGRAVRLRGSRIPKCAADRSFTHRPIADLEDQPEKFRDGAAMSNGTRPPPICHDAMHRTCIGRALCAKFGRLPVTHPVAVAISGGAQIMTRSSRSNIVCRCALAATAKRHRELDGAILLHASSRVEECDAQCKSAPPRTCTTARPLGESRHRIPRRIRWSAD